MIEAARKQSILKKREAELIRCLDRQSPASKIAAAAERVRAAKLAVFKAQTEISKYTETSSSKLEANIERHLERLEVRTEAWRSKPVEEIVAAYSVRHAR